VAQTGDQVRNVISLGQVRNLEMQPITPFSMPFMIALGGYLPNRFGPPSCEPSSRTEGLGGLNEGQIFKADVC